MEAIALVHVEANIGGSKLSCHGIPAMKMAERIRRARRKSGLSQAALAERLHVRRSAVSNWESVNDIQPTLQSLVALAKVCGISFESLGAGRGSMTQEEAFLSYIRNPSGQPAQIQACHVWIQSQDRFGFTLEASDLELFLTNSHDRRGRKRTNRLA